MTPEKQRIAIAEACGWRGISEHFLVGYAPWRTETYSDRVNACPVGDIDCIPQNPLPDYLNSLDAMHEAAKTVPPLLRGDYASHLAKIVGGKLYEVFEDDDMLFEFANATAAQHAKAFLHALNLWIED